MTQYTTNAQDTETFNQHLVERRTELAAHHWDRSKSVHQATEEGINLTDEHWAVIIYLRKRYLEQGLPRHARYLARELNQQFTPQGGNKYLRHLFPGGPVSQGSRLASLRTPADATDASFGTSY